MGPVGKRTTARSPRKYSGPPAVTHVWTAMPGRGEAGALGAGHGHGLTCGVVTRHGLSAGKLPAQMPLRRNLPRCSGVPAVRC